MGHERLADAKTATDEIMEAGGCSAAAAIEVTIAFDRNHNMINDQKWQAESAGMDKMDRFPARRPYVQKHGHAIRRKCT